MTSINKKNETTTTTHRVQEHELLRRLELLCETGGLEFFLRTRGRKMTTKHIFYLACVLPKI